MNYSNSCLALSFHGSTLVCVQRSLSRLIELRNFSKNYQAIAELTETKFIFFTVIKIIPSMTGLRKEFNYSDGEGKRIHY